MKVRFVVLCLESFFNKYWNSLNRSVVLSLFCMGVVLISFYWVFWKECVDGDLLIGEIYVVIFFVWEVILGIFKRGGEFVDMEDMV